jgi:hypothetical protein
MYRLLISCSAVLTAAAFVGAAPGPKGGDPAASYFPTAVGDKLVFAVTYRTADGAVVREEVRTRTVTAVQRTDGEVVVTTREEAEAGADPVTETYRVSSRGVFQVGRGTAVFDPPQCCLPRPAKAGATWEDIVPGEAPVTVKCTSAGEEEVEVPAGKFQAVRVERAIELPGKARMTTWEAPGLGTVKIRAWDSGGSEVTQVLKSFTPGKR